MTIRQRGSTALLLLAFCLASAHGPPALAGEDEVVEGALGRQLDAAVRRVTRDAFWGAVLVAKDGEILLAKGYGNADYAERPNTANTLFEIASTSKQITAAAILKLQMERRLKTSDTLAKFFRKVPKDKRSVTVHHLLTHTSGIPGDAGVPYASTISRKAYVEHVLGKPLVSKPGEVFAYNNAAYALLAAIVEEASKTSFEAYVKRRLFAPAGLEDTGFVKDDDLDRDRLSVRRGDRMPEATATDWFWGWGYRGMGGVVSTVHDLYLWDRALRGDAVLDAEAKAVYYAPLLEGYACGWRVERTDRGTTKIHHSGGVHGYACQYARYPEDDVVIVVLSNGRTNIHGVETELARLLFPPPPITATLNVGDFEPDEHQIAALPSDLAWAVETVDGSVLLSLEQEATGKTAATIRLPLGSAKKLAHDLAAALRDRAASSDTSEATAASMAIEAGLYLQPYRLSGAKLEIEDGLSLMLRARYVGRGEGGERVVDDRITLSVVDALRHQWPLMVKMGEGAAKKLLESLRKSLP